jgi:regulator of RNase E activity RraA
MWRARSQILQSLMCRNERRRIPIPSNPYVQPFCNLGRLRFIPAREDIDTYGTMTTCPNADNLQWQGVEQIREGDVLVIDSRDDPRAVSVGNIVVTRLLARGV